MKFQQALPRVEEEVLLCCSRTHIDAKTLGRLKALLEQQLDWPSLIRTALAHGVLPLLYANLHQHCHGVVPDPIRDELRDHCRANVQHSFFLTAELLKLIKVFDQYGIPAIPFKGPVLAASAYRDVTLRQFADLDILVHKKNIQEAGRLLLSQGYRSNSFSGDDSSHVTERDEVAFLGPQYYAFYRPDGRSRVDLQWRLTERYFSFSLDKERFWQHLAPVSLSGKAVYSFPPTDMLLILCVHGSKHRWEKLKWVCDVAELVRAHRGEIDWEEIQQQASQQGAEQMLGLGLFLAHELLGAELPEEVKQRVQANAKIRSVARQIRKRFFMRADRRPEKFEKIIFYLKTKDYWSESWQFCFRYVSEWFLAAVTPKPVDRQMLPLPAALSFLYYFVRPVRLMGKQAKSAATGITKTKIKQNK